MATIPQALLAAYQKMPDKNALVVLEAGKQDQPVSYRRLATASLGYTNALLAAGIQPGEVVILILPQREALVSAFFGAALAGAVPSIMPFLTEKLAPEEYRRSLAALLAVTRPAAVITYGEFVPEVRQAIGAHSSVRQVLVSEHLPSAAGLELHAAPGLDCHPGATALLQHSSGTTGLQKGVALSHRAIFNQLAAYSRSINLAPGDVVVSWLPLYHDMGLIAGFLLPLLTGTPLILMSPFDWVRAPQRLLQAVSQHQGTLSWMPNFAYNFCAKKIRPRDLEGVDLSSWRAVINCSEPMYWSSHRMFLERFAPYGLRETALATSYAMAENVFAVTQGGIDSPPGVDRIDRRALQELQQAVPAADTPEALKMLSAGRPIDNTRLRLVDTDGHSLPERQVGEIAIQSDCMLAGYYNRPDLTEHAFQNGWYLTGDLGYLADGELYVTGRKKDMIIVGGKNIYPQDLEFLASEVPGVIPGRAAAFGLPNELTGTEDVVLLAESELPAGEARAELAEALRVYVTRHSDVALRQVEIFSPGWLVKTSSGKVARSVNREKFLSYSHPAAPAEPPAGHAEPVDGAG